MVPDDVDEVLFDIDIDIGTSATGQSPQQECREQRLQHANWDELLRDHQRPTRICPGSCNWKSTQSNQTCPPTSGSRRCAAPVRSRPQRTGVSLCWRPHRLDQPGITTGNIEL